MAKTVEAIFENGVFIHVFPLDITEHKRVKLVIKDNKEESPDVLFRASMVYDGLSFIDTDDIEALAPDRSHFSRKN